jgi:hypothetical protein
MVENYIQKDQTQRSSQTYELPSSYPILSHHNESLHCCFITIDGLGGASKAKWGVLDVYGGGKFGKSMEAQFIKRNKV